MFRLCLLLGLVALAQASLQHRFQRWQKRFDISYETRIEEASRFEVWKRALATIRAHNSNPARTWDMGLNQFSAWTWEEFQARRLQTPQNCSATHIAHKPVSLAPKNGAYPKAIDWREVRVVSEVKDQARCGSCWTFSTTGALESHRALYWGEIVELSEQNLIDCAGAFNNNGCDGGLPSQAFEYVKYNRGLNTEFSYPYEGKNDKCRFDRTDSKIGIQVEDVYNVTAKDETEIYQAVAVRGPVSIAFDVASDFQHYKSGVYQSKICKTSPNEVNHAVLVVGYNVTTAGLPYWIVKNSWTWDWGMNGYFEILRGHNECGLADCASFPILPPKKSGANLRRVVG